MYTRGVGDKGERGGDSTRSLLLIRVVAVVAPLKDAQEVSNGLGGLQMRLLLRLVWNLGLSGVEQRHGGLQAAPRLHRLLTGTGSGTLIG